MELLNIESLEWVRLRGGQAFDYPIDYRATVLSSRDDGHIDLLFYWEPDSYCHFHRHPILTTSLVLSGELHVFDIDRGKQVGKRIRRAGDYASKPAGDVHMEHAGADGALVLFNLYAPDGLLFEVLDREENVLMPVTTDDVLSGRIAALSA